MKLKRSATERLQVEKKWGYEDWVVNDEKYCGKVLVMEEGWQGSIHRHTIKDETMLCIDGEIVLEVWPHGLGNEPSLVRLKAESRDSIRLEPGTWHRMSTPMGVDGVVVEFSTFHSEEDVERATESSELPTRTPRKDH